MAAGLPGQRPLLCAINRSAERAECHHPAGLVCHYVRVRAEIQQDQTQCDHEGMPRGQIGKPDPGHAPDLAEADVPYRRTSGPDMPGTCPAVRRPFELFLLRVTMTVSPWVAPRRRFTDSRINVSGLGPPLPGRPLLLKWLSMRPRYESEMIKTGACRRPGGTAAGLAGVRRTGAKLQA